MRIPFTSWGLVRRYIQRRLLCTGSGAVVHPARSSHGRPFIGKVAMVTASTDGIGLEVARKLAQDGAQVCVSSRKQTNVDKAVQTIESEGGKVFGTVCDVENSGQRDNLIKQMVTRFGGVDIAVFNAAVNPSFMPILQMTANAWDKIYEANVKANYHLTSQLLPHMEKRGGGSIIYVTTAGQYGASVKLIEHFGGYVVSKLALSLMMNVLANKMAAKNIRINAVAPGLIDTAFSRKIRENPNLMAEALDLISMQRMGSAEEVMEGIYFLLSEDAEFITGETLGIHGGAISRL